MRGSSASEQAERVEARQDEDVNERDAFEIKGLGDGAGYVKSKPEHEFDRQGSCEGEAEDKEYSGEDDSCGGREVTGSERTRTLSSAASVGLNVEEIVDKISA